LRYELVIRHAEFIEDGLILYRVRRLRETHEPAVGQGLKPDQDVPLQALHGIDG